MERVLVTGLGVVSRVGADLEAYWRGLMVAKSMPQPVDDPFANMDNRLLYAVGDAERFPPPGAGGRAGRASTFAVAAARGALRDAGLQAADLAGAGVALGTGVGDESLYEDVPGGARPPSGPDAFPFKVSSVVAAALGLAGPVLSISTACSASAYSVSLAADMIRDGEADVVVTGGADGYTRVGVACFNRMRALDPVRCRPFDAGRRGTVFGEGAALLVLESESHARRRGHAHSYAEVEGAGWSCDAHHATAPEAGAVQIVRAMQGALDEAGVGPREVSCVVPHGTGTPLNDTVESRALKEVFGPDVARMAVYSLKAMLGHTGGAAGAFALLTAALILERGEVPPNAAPDDPDPECAMVLHTGGPVPLDAASGSHVLVNAYAFGGNNISVLIGRRR